MGGGHHWQAPQPLSCVSVRNAPTSHAMAYSVASLCAVVLMFCLPVKSCGSIRDSLRAAGTTGHAYRSRGLTSPTWRRRYIIGTHSNVYGMAYICVARWVSGGRCVTSWGGCCPQKTQCWSSGGKRWRECTPTWPHSNYYPPETSRYTHS